MNAHHAVFLELEDATGALSLVTVVEGQLDEQDLVVGIDGIEHVIDGGGKLAPAKEVVQVAQNGA